MGCSCIKEIDTEKEDENQIKNYDCKDRQNDPNIINRNEQKEKKSEHLNNFTENNKNDELKNNDEDNKNDRIIQNDNKSSKINEQQLNSIEPEFKKEETNMRVEEKKKEVSFKCIYEIKDNNEIQILNYRNEDNINEDIKSKIKIVNNNKIEDLIYKKNLTKLG